MTIGTTIQIISISISNYYRYHEAKALEESKANLLFDMIALKIAQSTRHELANIHAEQQIEYLNFEQNLSGDKNKKTIKDGMKQFRSLIERFGESINKLRFNTPSATPQLQTANIKTIWLNTVQLIKQRLDYQKIEVFYSGGDIQDMFYTDLLSSAFLNLLLNSIDAFKDKQKRTIKLVVHNVSDQAHDYVLDYSDNAGGINFPKLHIPSNIIESNKNMSNEQIIFQPTVTTKKDKVGSGWGLYLVRRAIAMHKGSINLFANTNEGCTFRITLKKHLVDNKLG